MPAGDAGRPRLRPAHDADDRRAGLPPFLQILPGSVITSRSPASPVQRRRTRTLWGGSGPDKRRTSLPWQSASGSGTPPAPPRWARPPTASSSGQRWSTLWEARWRTGERAHDEGTVGSLVERLARACGPGLERRVRIDRDGRPECAGDLSPTRPRPRAQGPRRTIVAACLCFRPRRAHPDRVPGRSAP